MSLKHILLGMLHQPQSGYDLKKKFDRSLRNFWRAELSQIYPQLQKLQSEGLLTSKAGASEIGPTRRVYRRSARGDRELTSWLQSGPKVGTERIGYLAQIFFLAELEDQEAATDFMQALRDHMAAWLASLESAEEEWRRNEPGYPDDMPDDQFFAQLTLDMGLRKARATIEWCDDSIARIKARQPARSLAKTAQ